MTKISAPVGMAEGPEKVFVIDNLGNQFSGRRAQTPPHHSMTCTNTEIFPFG